jgi:hypothetical protein
MAIGPLRSRPTAPGAPHAAHAPGDAPRLRTVPPDEMRARFRANADAAAAAQPALAATLGAAVAQPHFEAYATASGGVHVVRAGRGPLDFAVPARDAAAIAAQPGMARGAILVAGLPAPALLTRLLALRGGLGFAPPIDVLEPDAGDAVIWLHVVDAADPLRSGRLRLHVGADAGAAYVRSRQADLARGAPTHVIRCARPGGALPETGAPFRTRVEAAAAEVRRKLRARQDDFYAGATPEAWGRRFAAAGGRAPLRVLIFTTRYSTVLRHVARDLARAFGRAGATCRAVTEPYDAAAVVDVWTPLAAAPVDLVILLNHLRRDLASDLHPSLPVAAWSQDYTPAIWSRDAAATLGPLDLLVSRGTAALEARHGYDRARMLESSNLTDPETFSAAPLPESALAPYRCDVAYVGHGSATPAALVEEIAAGAPAVAACLRAFLDLARRELAARRFLPLVARIALLDEAARSVPGVARGTILDAPLVEAAHRVYDRLLRHETLEWCAAWARRTGRTLRIHGRGWDAHPALARWAAPEIEHGEPLRALAQAAAVTLQVHGYDSLHQRLLDACAAGGLVVTRFNPVDFLPAPLAVLRRELESQPGSDLASLVARARRDREVRRALRRVERLSGLRLAPAADAQRRAQIDLLARSAVPPGGGEDAGLEALVRSHQLAPRRTAGEIPGFARTVFATPRRLGAILDRFAGDPAARRRIAAPMRAHVAAHFTYDGLVARIVAHFAALGAGDEARHGAGARTAERGKERAPRHHPP